MLDLQTFLLYFPRIIAGIKITCLLSILAFIAAFLLAMFISWAKLAKNKYLAAAANIYTTVLRGIPDLIQLFLFFYGLQHLFLLLESNFSCLENIKINNFYIAVIALSLIYSAYLSETIKGAILLIKQQEIYAARAYAFSNQNIFFKIKLRQIMIYALTGLENNTLVLLKTTALVSLLQIDDLSKVIKEVANNSFFINSNASLRLFMYSLGAFIYLLISSAILLFFLHLQHKYQLEDKENYALIMSK